jgi:hypothetical protein
VRPTYRAILRQPGFLVPKESIAGYEGADDKGAFLDTMFELVLAGKLMKEVDPFTP